MVEVRMYLITYKHTETDAVKNKTLNIVALEQQVVSSLSCKSLWIKASAK